MSANVRKGSDVLSEVLAEDSRATRIGLSAAARKAAEHLAASKPTKIVRKHHALRSLVDSAATVHNWRERSQVNVATGVNFTVPDEVLERLRALKAGS